MEFVATESGFAEGMGGASNSAGTTEYHYVLFGRDTDGQHPERSGVYFEFDDQIYGAVDCVTKIAMADDWVRFELKDGQNIVVRCGMAQAPWSVFLRGIQEAFAAAIIHREQP